VRPYKSGMLRRAIAAVALLLAMSAYPAAACDLVGTSAVLDLYLDAVRARDDGDHERAAAQLEQARRLAPDDVELALEMARAYVAAGRWGAAAAAYGEAAQLAPRRVDVAVEQARFHLGHAFRVRAARDAAERAAVLAPADPAVVELLDRARVAAALTE
jgi:cytochrome c-type biogenesis protein CcmH/NrfG